MGDAFQEICLTSWSEAFLISGIFSPMFLHWGITLGAVEDNRDANEENSRR